MACTNCKQLSRIQTEVILRHKDEHKLFHGLKSDKEAIEDFVKKFGWLMREMYCMYSCPDFAECDVDIDTLCFDSRRGKPR